MCCFPTEQLERNLYQLQRKQGYSTPDTELKREMQRKDALIAKLIMQSMSSINISHYYRICPQIQSADIFYF